MCPGRCEALTPATTAKTRAHHIVIRSNSGVRVELVPHGFDTCRSDNARKNHTRIAGLTIHSSGAQQQRAGSGIMRRS